MPVAGRRLALEVASGGDLIPESSDLCFLIHRSFLFFSLKKKEFFLIKEMHSLTEQ